MSSCWITFQTLLWIAIVGCVGLMLRALCRGRL